MINDLEQIKAISARFSFLQQADETFNSIFFRCVNLVRLSRGTAICQEGAQCNHLALVLSGTVRVFKLSESGREITLYRVGPGQSCILTASCIISASPFPAYAVCEEDAAAIVISTHDVQQWLNDSIAWRRYLFGLISERLSDVITIVEEVAFKRVDRRIAGYLLARAAATKHVLVKATHQEIASELGTSREVVSRILKDLEHQKSIRVSRGEIELIDMTGLREKAGEG